jgi:hypothetical protein
MDQDLSRCQRIMHASWVEQRPARSGVVGELARDTWLKIFGLRDAFSIAATGRWFQSVMLKFLTWPLFRG